MADKDGFNADKLGGANQYKDFDKRMKSGKITVRQDGTIQMNLQTTAMPCGVEPTGIVPITELFEVLMTDTVLEPELVT
jgi:hypothetical protein